MTPTAPMTMTAASIRKVIMSVVDAFQLCPVLSFEAEFDFLALRGRLAALPPAALDAHQHVVLAVHEILVTVVGQLELVAQHHGAGGTRLLAEAAEDAPQHVDLVDLGVALACRYRVGWVVLCRLYVDGVGRAGRGAQATADALLEPRVRVPEQ